MNGHWARICRTAKHWVNLYQASLQKKGKAAEANFAEASTSMPTLDVSDFFIDDNYDNNDNNNNYVFGNMQNM